MGLSLWTRDKRVKKSGNKLNLPLPRKAKLIPHWFLPLAKWWCWTFDMPKAHFWGIISKKRLHSQQGVICWPWCVQCKITKNKYLQKLCTGPLSDQYNVPTHKSAIPMNVLHVCGFGMIGQPYYICSQTFSCSLDWRSVLLSLISSLTMMLPLQWNHFRRPKVKLFEDAS